MAIKWNTEAYFEKASRGSFAAKAARADVYRSNSEIFRAGAYETASGKTVTLNPESMLSGTIVYDASIDVPEVPQCEAPVTGVVNAGCLEIGRELQLKGYNPVILNLADAYMACGFYKRGSSAQEESLCRQTTLSQALYQYYDAEDASACGVAFREKKYPMDLRHGAIYSPHVTVFRKGSRDGYALLDEPYETAIISCAALDFNEKHGKNREYRAADGGFTREGGEIMTDKIRTIYGAALAAGHDALVLGAFGCGAFRLRPDLVAQLFHEVLFEPAFRNRFRAVAFAILEKSGPESGVNGKFGPFYRVFGRYGSAQKTMMPPAPKASAVDMSTYAVGQTVAHDKFGTGTVTGIQPEMGRVTVDFVGFGTKTLAVEKAKLTILNRS